MHNCDLELYGKLTEKLNALTDKEFIKLLVDAGIKTWPRKECFVFTEEIEIDLASVKNYYFADKDVYIFDDDTVKVA